jgi:hypothetical protein
LCRGAKDNDDADPVLQVQARAQPALALVLLVINPARLTAL